jgi:hypothetical protein
MLVVIGIDCIDSCKSNEQILGKIFMYEQNLGKIYMYEQNLGKI